MPFFTAISSTLHRLTLPPPTVNSENTILRILLTYFVIFIGIDLQALLSEVPGLNDPSARSRAIEYGINGLQNLLSIVWVRYAMADPLFNTSDWSFFHVITATFFSLVSFSLTSVTKAREERQAQILRARAAAAAAAPVQQTPAGTPAIFHPDNHFFFQYTVLSRSTSDFTQGDTIEVECGCGGHHTKPPLPMRDEDDLKCSICLGNYEAGDLMDILPCEHRFHTECIRQHYQQHLSCVQCTKEITWCMVMLQEEGR